MCLFLGYYFIAPIRKYMSSNNIYKYLLHLLPICANFRLRVILIVDLAHLNEIVSIDFNCVKVYLKSKKVVANAKQ